MAFDISGSSISKGASTGYFDFSFKTGLWHKPELKMKVVLLQKLFFSLHLHPIFSVRSLV